MFAIASIPVVRWMTINLIPCFDPSTHAVSLFLNLPPAPVIPPASQQLLPAPVIPRHADGTLQGSWSRKLPYQDFRIYFSDRWSRWSRGIISRKGRSYGAMEALMICGGFLNPKLAGLQCKILLNMDDLEALLF